MSSSRKYPTKQECDERIFVAENHVDAWCRFNSVQKDSDHDVYAERAKLLAYEECRDAIRKFSSVIDECIRSPIKK